MSKKHDETDIKITCLHVEKEVTGSQFLIQVDGLNILFDMGLFQSNIHSYEEVSKINYRKLPIDYSKLDYVIISHSHADHVGGMGILGKVDNGFKGSILCTEPTQALMELNLNDSAFLQLQNCEMINKHRPINKLEPLYNRDDVERVMGFVRGYGYDTDIYLNDKVSIKFLANGHIAGSASIYLTYKKDKYITKRILYTGDHSFGKNKPFTKAWNYEGLEADIILTESTYSGIYNAKYNPLDELERYIMEECYQQDKILFLPCFSIARSTELIYMLKKIYDRNLNLKDKNIPITFASMMLTRAHRIIGKPEFKCFYDEKWSKDEKFFDWDGVNFIEKYKDVESKLFNNRCRIVGASSGMLQGGYAKALLHSYLPNKNVDILFSGYCSEGTNSRKILNQDQKTINIDNKPVKIHAKVLGILDGMSSHADMNGLLGLIKTCDRNSIKKILIVHGNYDRQLIFQSELEREYPKAEILIPDYKQVIKI